MYAEEIRLEDVIRERTELTQSLYWGFIPMISVFLPSYFLFFFLYTSK
jgi:hypothetical protein